jgi:integrase
LPGACGRPGFQDASFHTLPHTLASALLSNRIPLSAVNARLGHAYISITARIGGHAIQDDANRAADAFGNFGQAGRRKTPVRSSKICAWRPAALAGL